MDFKEALKMILDRNSASLKMNGGYETWTKRDNENLKAPPFPQKFFQRWQY